MRTKERKRNKREEEKDGRGVLGKGKSKWGAEGQDEGGREGSKRSHRVPKEAGCGEQRGA